MLNISNAYIGDVPVSAIYVGDIKVWPSIQAPDLSGVTISGAPAQNGKAYSAVPILANAAEAGSIVWTYSYTGSAPSWASFNTSTGTLSGTPPNGVATNSGTVTVRATNSAGYDETTYTLAAYDLTFTGSPPTSVDAGNSYGFSPSGSSNEPDTVLSFTIVNKPYWANFSSSSGTLSAIPENSNVGVYPNITITAHTDEGRTKTIGPFSIEVIYVDDGPPILP